MIAVVSEEKNSGSGSPFWTSSRSQSMVAPSRRGGVPVLSRAKREPGGVQTARQRDRGLVAEPAGRGALVAEMDDPAQEGAGGQDDRSAGNRAAVGEFDARDRARLGQDARRLAFDDGQVRGLRNQFLHRAPVELPVGLGAGSLDGRALAAVEDAKLDPGLVGGARHHPVERVDLAHEMPLAEAADRRVAGHFADGRETMGHQRRRGARARRGGRRFAARVAAADDDDVKSHERASACFT